MTRIYTQDDRQELLDDGAPFRKTARIVAVKQTEPFIVHTEHGPISGEAGDWLATNHPSDDPGSDIWPISAERMKNTYVSTDDMPIFPKQFKFKSDD
jgi:hypothetical protein